MKQINHYFTADAELLRNSAGLTAQQMFILGAVRMFQQHYGCYNQGLEYFAAFYDIKKSEIAGLKEDFNELGRRSLLVASPIENGTSIKLEPAYKCDKKINEKHSNELF